MASLRKTETIIKGKGRKENILVFAGVIITVM